MTDLSRRRFLRGVLFGAIAAPIIVRASSLMSLTAVPVPEPPILRELLFWGQHGRSSQAIFDERVARGRNGRDGALFAGGRHWGSNERGLLVPIRLSLVAA